MANQSQCITLSRILPLSSPGPSSPPSPHLMSSFSVSAPRESGQYIQWTPGFCIRNSLAEALQPFLPYFFPRNALLLIFLSGWWTRRMFRAWRGLTKLCEIWTFIKIKYQGNCQNMCQYLHQPPSTTKSAQDFQIFSPFQRCEIKTLLMQNLLITIL